MTQRLRASLAGFWADDHGLSIFLASLSVVVFVLPPLVPAGPVGRLLTDAFFSIMLVSGTAAVAGTRRERLTVLTIALAAVVVRWATWFFPQTDLAVWRDLSVLATFVPLNVVTLRLVLRRGPVTRRRIEGAVAVYVLLGLTWAQAYALLAHRHPGAFAGATGGNELEGWIYYSFVTLTTMGYGDITPVHPTARSLAIVEALIGQLYPAILLARLVSLELHSRQGGRSDLAGGGEQRDVSATASGEQRDVSATAQPESADPRRS